MKKSAIKNVLFYAPFVKKRFAGGPAVTARILEEKKELFKTGENYVDKWLKVKFFELTDDGIPRFPVGIGFRPEKDM